MNPFPIRGLPEGTASLHSIVWYPFLSSIPDTLLRSPTPLKENTPKPLLTLLHVLLKVVGNQGASFQLENVEHTLCTSDQKLKIWIHQSKVLVSSLQQWSFYVLLPSLVSFVYFLYAEEVFYGDSAPEISRCKYFLHCRHWDISTVTRIKGCLNFRCWKPSIPFTL